MAEIRNITKQHWAAAEQADALQKFIALEADLSSLFVGATSLSQVVNLLLTEVYEESPELIANLECTFPNLVQLLSVGFQRMVIRSLTERRLTQPEHLICLLARHFAQRQYQPALLPPFADMASQMLTLDRHWNNEMRKQRINQSNMLNQN